MKYAIQNVNGRWWLAAPHTVKSWLRNDWGSKFGRMVYAREDLPIRIGESLFNLETMTYRLDAEGGGTVARVVEV